MACIILSTLGSTGDLNPFIALGLALRFGVPSLVVPWGVDQFYSASQITRVGAGNFLYWRQFTPASAQVSLSALVNDRNLRIQAHTLSEAIGHENGTTTLCEAILSLL